MAPPAAPGEAAKLRQSACTLDKAQCQPGAALAAAKPAAAPAVKPAPAPAPAPKPAEKTDVFETCEKSTDKVAAAEACELPSPLRLCLRVRCEPRARPDADLAATKNHQSSPHDNHRHNNKTKSWFRRVLNKTKKNNPEALKREWKEKERQRVALAIQEKEEAEQMELQRIELHEFHEAGHIIHHQSVIGIGIFTKNYSHWSWYGCTVRYNPGRNLFHSQCRR